MTTRRKFFQIIGLGAAVAAGGKAAIAAALPKPEKKEITNKLESNSSDGNIEFNTTYSVDSDSGPWYGDNAPQQYQERMRFHSGGMSISPYGQLTIGKHAPGTKLQVVKVGMKPGPDGELYLKTNGKWRKIVTE